MIPRVLAVAKALTYFGPQIAYFDLKQRIERGWGKRARAYNASHPPPPGIRLGASWVARRRQDIDE